MYMSIRVVFLSIVYIIYSIYSNYSNYSIYSIYRIYNTYSIWYLSFQVTDLLYIIGYTSVRVFNSDIREINFS